MIKAGNIFPPLEARSMDNTICLFDVDGTLNPEKQVDIALRHYVCLAPDMTPS
jgi:hypothetical protein